MVICYFKVVEKIENKQETEDARIYLQFHSSLRRFLLWPSSSSFIVSVLRVAHISIVTFPCAIHPRSTVSNCSRRLLLLATVRSNLGSFFSKALCLTARISIMRVF